MSENSSDLQKRLGAASFSTKVILRKGETFWGLAEVKYAGKHPIAAIYAANKLKAAFERRDGKQVLVDPIYLAGVEYTLPAEAQIEQLTAEFWSAIDGRSLQDRVGAAAERTTVCLRWDETFSQLSAIKYNGVDHSKAIFQANNMVPKMTLQDSSRRVQPPICQAGCSYIFPALNEIAELEKQYDSVMSEITAQARESANNQDK